MYRVGMFLFGHSFVYAASPLRAACICKESAYGLDWSVQRHISKPESQRLQQSQVDHRMITMAKFDAQASHAAIEGDAQASGGLPAV